jgi:hypothetical protein
MSMIRWLHCRGEAESTPVRRECMQDRTCYSGVMPLSDQHRHALLLADRTHDVGVVTTVVAEVLTASRETNLLEIEQAFRDGAAAAYLVATSDGFEVVLGLMAMLAAVGKAGVTSAENRAALAATRTSKS